MKKLILLAAVVLFGFSATAQNFGGGVSIGLPVGDAGDISTFNVSLDLSYLWDVSEDFEAGVLVGFSQNFGDSVDIAIGDMTESIDYDDVQFLPVAGRGMYSLSEDFSLGMDLGYAVGINDGNDGGFLWSPRAAYGLGASTELVLSYNNVSLDGGTWSNLNLGVGFKF